MNELALLIRENISNMMDTINNSEGIAGWHDNGDIAKWSEGHEAEMSEALDAITEIIEIIDRRID